MKLSYPVGNRPHCDRPIELSVMIGQVLNESDILRYNPNDSGLTL
ncbi:hypothetical protein QUB60_08010 [Microcoleus sp. A2-C5]